MINVPISNFNVPTVLYVPKLGTSLLLSYLQDVCYWYLNIVKDNQICSAVVIRKILNYFVYLTG
jgi:hypothetical protein